MNTKKIAAITAAALAAVLAIAGCTAAADPEPTTAPTQTAEPTTKPTESPEPTEAPAPEVPEYTLADGTTVAIDPAAPLPDEVVADIEAKHAVSASPASEAETTAGLQKSLAASEQVAAHGKVAYVIVSTGTYDISGNLVDVRYAAMVMDPSDPLVSDDYIFPDHATAVRTAQERVATSPNPERYVILDLVS